MKFLIDDYLLYFFQGDTHVGAEFLNGKDLMAGFIQCLFDCVDEIAAVSFAFSQDALNVFGINADSGYSRFHRVVFLCWSKFWKQNEFLSVGIR